MNLISNLDVQTTDYFHLTSSTSYSIHNILRRMFQAMRREREKIERTRTSSQTGRVQMCTVSGRDKHCQFGFWVLFFLKKSDAQ